MRTRWAPSRPRLHAALLGLVLVGGGLLVASRLATAPVDQAERPQAQPAAEPSPSAETRGPSSLQIDQTTYPSPHAAADDLPVAVGEGVPRCTGPCVVEHRLTRSFLSGFRGEQTLLLARSEAADADGNNLHAFLVDGEGRVLWEEHGFGWTWQRVDPRFVLRFDDASNVYFRSYVADFTYLYVLHTGDDEPRLVGSPAGEPDEGFQGGQVHERRGQAAFDVTEQVVDCPPGEETVLECPFHEVTYRWDGSRFAKT